MRGTHYGIGTGQPVYNFKSPSRRGQPWCGCFFRLAPRYKWPHTSPDGFPKFSAPGLPQRRFWGRHEFCKSLI